MGNTVLQWSWWILLGWLGLEDLRTKRLPWHLLIPFTIATLLLLGKSFLLSLKAIKGAPVWYGLIYGGRFLLLMLLMALFYSLNRKKVLGSGDLWILCLLFLSMSTDRFFGSLLFAYVNATICGYLIMAFRHKESETIPFVPFLFLGTLLMKEGRLV